MNFTTPAHSAEKRDPVQIICASFARSLYTGSHVVARDERIVGRWV